MQQKILDNVFNTTTYPDNITISRLKDRFNKMYKDHQPVSTKKARASFSRMREALRIKNIGLKKGEIDEIHCKKWKGKYWESLCDVYQISH